MQLENKMDRLWLLPGGLHWTWGRVSPLPGMSMCVCAPLPRGLEKTRLNSLLHGHWRGREAGGSRSVGEPEHVLTPRCPCSFSHAPPFSHSQVSSGAGRVSILSHGWRWWIPWCFAGAAVSFAFHPDVKPSLQQLWSAVGRGGLGGEGTAPGLWPSPRRMLSVHFSVCLFLSLPLPLCLLSFRVPIFSSSSLYFSLLSSSLSLGSWKRPCFYVNLLERLFHSGQGDQQRAPISETQMTAAEEIFCDNRGKAWIQPDLDSTWPAPLAGHENLAK